MRKSNSTTRVYFVGKEESPIVQTNGRAKPVSHSEAHKFDKVSFMFYNWIIVSLVICVSIVMNLS